MSEPRTLLTGLALGESPRWHDDRLLLSDWGTGEILAVHPDGGTEVVVGGLPMPFCFDRLPDGRLLVVSGRDGLLLRREPDGTMVTHADLTTLGAPPWNDIVVDGRGNAYVGSIGFDFPAGDFATGIVALVTPDGTAREVADGVSFVNGMVVTPDGSTLIVAESYASRLTAFDITADGGLAKRRLWADLGDGAPDGICLDAEDAVWYADVPHRRAVRVREGGEVSRTVELDRGCFACMLGGTDRRTLFLVAAEWPAAMTGAERTGRLFAVEAPAPGAGRP